METLSPLTGEASASPLVAEPYSATLPDRPTLDLPFRLSPPQQFTLGLGGSRALDDVLAEVEADDRGKWDTIAARQQLFLHNGRLILPSAYEDDCPTILTPSPWATSQLCQRLGIPAAYFKKCPSHLQDAQFNHWVQQARGHSEMEDEQEAEDGEECCPHCPPSLMPLPSASNPSPKPEAWLLRGKGSRLRGVLSERYAKLDNAQLLHYLSPLLESRMEVKGFALSEQSLHLRVVDPRLSREVLPDDRLLVGLHIANSEVGLRAVSIDALVYRLVCANGLIRLVKGRSLFRQRHVSWDAPRFEESLRAAIGEAVTVAAGLLEQLAWATRAPVADVEGTLAALAAHWNLTQALKERVKQTLITTPASQQETVYGLVNALTQSAQSLPADERYSLEVLAGRLVEQGLPKAASRTNGHAHSLTNGLHPQE